MQGYIEKDIEESLEKLRFFRKKTEEDWSVMPVVSLSKPQALGLLAEVEMLREVVKELEEVIKDE